MLVAPPELVLETSFVVDALVRTQPRHDICAAFLRAIADTSGTVYYNNLLIPELWEAAYAIALRETHRGQWRKHRHDLRSLRPAKRLRDRMQAAWETALDALNAVVLDVGEVTDAVPDLMALGLSSSDAVHAATALYVDVQAFVTLDYHFSHVPPEQLGLYVPPDRVRPCRARRAAR